MMKQLKFPKMNRRIKKEVPDNVAAPKRKINPQNLFTLLCLAFLVFAHVAILLAIILSWRYYAIYPSLFGSVVGIILCSLIIIDIVFFVGFNHQDLFLKIVSSVMAVLLLIGGTVGSYYIRKVNATVNNLLDDGKSDKYETFSGVFVCYDKYNKFKSLSDLAGKKVGLLLETSDGITYIANDLLAKEKIDFATVDYKTNAEMMQGLIDGDVDAIAITSAYRTIYGKGANNDAANAETTETEEVEETEVSEETETSETTEVAQVEEVSPFAPYLEHLIDFQSFEQELKVNTTRTKKNLSTDPFNVLLIGYSRTELGSSVGLADSIILTTINPQTYTVSMTSIARDSFVPVACYGGEYDKINSGRSTSRACFIETVENFIGEQIDYYMELDYLGLVQIVNVIGGIYINNPVEFTLDGIYVPAGEHVFADGQMALQFCRERHHMPGGDFARQQHQKEVIIEIAKAFIRSRDIKLALRAMEEASEWMSTDFTLSQLTGLFNLLINTKNYTTLDTFSLVDFQNSRITGNGGLMYYSYSMRLPLWVYLVYQGSYDESIEHMHNVMGNYKTIKQEKNFEYSINTKYVRDPYYSLDYEEKYLFTPDPMPPFWASLTDMSLSDAIAWADANGVGLSVNYIKPGDSGYDESLQGMVVSQSPRYGSLISEYGSGSIEVMAMKEIDPSKQVPDFVEHSYQKAKEWAREYGIRISIDFDTDVDGKVGDVVSQDPKPYTDIDRVDTLRIVVKAGKQRISFDANGHGTAPSAITIITGDDAESFPSMSSVTESDGYKYVFAGWYTSADGGTRVYSTDEVSGDTTVYAHWTKECASHDMGEWKTKEGGKATCEHGSYQERKCKKCDYTESREADDKLPHSWSQWTTVEEPTCEHGTIQERECSVCHTKESQELDDKKTEGCDTGGGE